VVFFVSKDRLTSFICKYLNDVGANEECQEVLSDLMVKAQIEGPESHGVAMLPSYLSALRSGWSNGCAEPNFHQIAPGRLHVDNDNGYCQIGLARARTRLIEAVETCGIALLTSANTHHLGALRFDTFPLAKAGYIAMAFVNSRAHVVPDGGTTRVFGTNPMSFACPRRNSDPIVWDQASSVQALSDIKLSALNNEVLPVPSGLDQNQKPTRRAREIIESGKLLPFGGHKGNAICLMVEILSAALGGGTLSFEVNEMNLAGATTVRPGYCIILIKPDMCNQDTFADRVDRLFNILKQDGVYIPGDRKCGRINAAKQNGIALDSNLMSILKAAGIELFK